MARNGNETSAVLLKRLKEGIELFPDNCTEIIITTRIKIDGRKVKRKTVHSFMDFIQVCKRLADDLCGMDRKPGLIIIEALGGNNGTDATE